MLKVNGIFIANHQHISHLFVVRPYVWHRACIYFLGSYYCYSEHAFFQLDSYFNVNFKNSPKREATITSHTDSTALP